MALRHEGHEGQAPRPHLMAQVAILTPMTMVDQQPRLRHQRITGTQQSITDIQITAAGKRAVRCPRPRQIRRFRSKHRA